MAFNAANFHRLSHVGANISHFVYTSSETLLAVTSATSPTFFAFPSNSTGNIIPLSTGDLIFVDASDGQQMFRVTTIASSTSSPYSTAVTLTGAVAPLEIAVTTGTLTPYGFYHSTAASGQTAILAMPHYAGQMVVLANSVSTSWTINTASTAAGSINSTMVSILINAPNQSVTLLGESTARWLVVGQSQPGTAIIGPLYS